MEHPGEGNRPGLSQQERFWPERARRPSPGLAMAVEAD